MQTYNEYSQNHDVWLLKDVIIYIHHGIELLMKQILVNKDEYLIFEDLREIAKKKKMADEEGCALFFLDNPCQTSPILSNDRTVWSDLIFVLKIDFIEWKD